MTIVDLDQLFGSPAEFDWGPPRAHRSHRLATAVMVALLTVALATAAAVILWSLRMG